MNLFILDSLWIQTRSDAFEDSIWDTIVQETFRMVKDKKGGGNVFGSIISGTLNVSGGFKVFQVLKFVKKHETTR